MIINYKQGIYKNIFLITYCMLLILFINVKTVNARYNTIFFILLFPVVVYSLILNLKRKTLMFGLMNAINIEMGTAMFFYLYIVNVKIIGWRLHLYSVKNADMAFSYFLISECIFMMLYFGWNYRERFDVEINVERPQKIYSQFLMRLFISVVPFIFLMRVDIFLIRDYSVNFNGYAGTMFSFGSVLSCLLAKAKCKNFYLNLFDWGIMIVYAVIALILALKGYRTYLCAMLFSYIAITIMYKKVINIKTVFRIVVLGIVIYALMIFAKGVFKGLPPSTYVASHESSVFFSLIAMIRNVGENGTENAYLNILESLLPSAISHKENMNSGAFMMRYIDAVQYASTKVSIGTYFLAEGYLSYGKIGIPIISIVYGCLALIMDRAKSMFCKKPLLFMFYIYMISQLYSAMWYGAYAFVKNTAYFVLLVSALNFRYVVTGKTILYKLRGEYIE